MNQGCSSIIVPKFIGKYKVIKTLGKGGFAVVVLAEDIKTGENVAIKIVDRKEIANHKMLLFLENELRLSQRFHHPNIVEVYDIIYQENVINIVMEYLHNGDLQSLLERGMCFAEDEQIIIAYKILDAMHYLHQRGISHRDIKPENILFDSQLNPKLIDFGLSRENASALSTFCGTAFYMAPELVNCDVYDGRKSDIWAFGITAHVLAAQRFPWTRRSEVQMIKDLQENKLELIIEDVGLMTDIIKKCLVMNPKERMSTLELMGYIEQKAKLPINVSKSDAPLPKIHERSTYQGPSLPKLHFRITPNMQPKARERFIPKRNRRIQSL